MMISIFERKITHNIVNVMGRNKDEPPWWGVLIISYNQLRPKEPKPFLWNVNAEIRHFITSQIAALSQQHGSVGEIVDGESIQQPLAKD